MFTLSTDSMDLVRIITSILAALSLASVLYVILSGAFKRYPGVRLLFGGTALFQIFCIWAELAALGRPPRGNTLYLVLLMMFANVLISAGIVVRARAEQVVREAKAAGPGETRRTLL